jgi:hypothetical protein
VVLDSMRPPVLFEERYSIVVGGDHLNDGLHWVVPPGLVIVERLDVGQVVQNRSRCRCAASLGGDE